MKKSTVLTAIILSLILVAPAISLSGAQVAKAVEKPIVVVTSAATDNFSCYNITATTDDGKIEFLFIWQRGIEWTSPWFGVEKRYIFNTPPILQMSKYFSNGTLDCSITYIPLFLLQYNDTNDNGLFDFWTRDHEEFSEEIWDDDIEWEELVDRPYKIYPLASIFQFIQHQYSWGWSVPDHPKEENITVTVDSQTYGTYEYSWNISATIPALPWLHEWGDYGDKLEATTISVSFGYHIQLLPENPVVKYDFNFSDITWANENNATKLTMMSAILYYSREAPVVCVGTKHLYGFDKTMEWSVPMFTISENATKAVQAFVSYSPNATIDGTPSPNVVKTALQPLFLIPTPVLVPEGVYVRGTYPGMEGTRTWRHYLAFAHQLGLPHFNEYIAQDPVIGLAATLSTVTLPFIPGDLLPLKALIIAAIVATITFTVYYLRKRRTAAPILTPQTKL